MLDLFPVAPVVPESIPMSLYLSALTSRGVHAGSITVVKALGPDSDSFVTSETVDGSGADIVGLYDLAATGGSVQGMKPITVWKVRPGAFSPVPTQVPLGWSIILLA